MAHWKPPANDSEAMLSAIGDPLRRRVLVAVGAAGQTSPSRLARRLKEEIPNVAYHVRAAVFYGVLECTGDRPINGSVESSYRLTDLGEQALRLAEASEIIESRHGGIEEEDDE